MRWKLAMALPTFSILIFSLAKSFLEEFPVAGELHHLRRITS